MSNNVTPNLTPLVTVTLTLAGKPSGTGTFRMSDPGFFDLHAIVYIGRHGFEVNLGTFSECAAAKIAHRGTYAIPIAKEYQKNERR
jgi:hypothetical protein